MIGEPARFLAHGMDKDLVDADWPPLTDDEVRTVLSHYEQWSPVRSARPAHVEWPSPRPMSAGALVRVADDVVFVKRHHRAVRSAQRLRTEHAFADHLRAHGQSVPAVLRRADGDTVVTEGDFLYEVHTGVSGEDLYRDVPSWYPFWSPAHARAAGRALARFHSAAQGFSKPASAPGVLTDSVAIIAASDPLARLEQLVEERPGLARALGEHRVLEDFVRHQLPAIERAAPLVATLTTQWTHGDWHGSNLAWSSGDASADVVEVFDLGLANQTYALHDLAVAIERSAVDWLDVAGRGVVADLDMVDALVGGYAEVRPLGADELRALTAILPVAHLEFALSEVEYFGDVVHSSANLDLAYDGYFLGHTRWFAEGPGAALVKHLRPAA